jgi:tetratricopeptide (TPR) repeat protein
MITKKIIISNLLLIAFSLLHLTSFSQDRVKAAQELLFEGKYKKALELIELDITKEGENEHNMLIKSRTLMYVDADKAWENISKSINKFPISAKSYYIRGIFYFELRQMENSVIDLTKAIELCKDDSFKFDILLARSGSLHYMNEIDKAINDDNEALKLRPNDIKVLNNLSTALFDKGSVDESEKILLKIKTIDSTFIGTYVNLGYQMQQVGKFEKAKNYLLQGLLIEPENYFLLNNLGYTDFKLGNIDIAIKNINKSLKVNPTNSYAYRNLALIYLHKNQKDKACENINKALSYKFTEMYGNEVKELKDKNCL